MPTIRAFSLTYDALNEQRSFSEGDTVTGEVTLSLAQDAAVEELFVKAKGDANVHWSEKSGEHTHSYNAHHRFFKVKQVLIGEDGKDNQISMGVHVYKFSLRIPSGNMPSSFKGLHGKIVYKLEAKLARKWKLGRSAEEVLNFTSRSISNHSHLMTRQVGATDKDVGVFSKGSVHMDASIDSSVYSPGDTVTIAVKVNNSSSKDMTPKFSLKQMILYRAQGHSKHNDTTVLKLEGDVIEKKSEKSINCGLRIPPDQVLTIQNCDIITLEYQLKVYLDISFASDPEIKFPLVLMPVGFRSNPGPGMQAYPPVAFGGPSNSDFPPPAAHFMPPPPAGPNAYGHPAAFPACYGAVPGPPPPVYPAYPPMPGAQPAMFLPALPVAAGAPYYNPAPPQNVSPYGPPSQSSLSSPVHHPPPPTAPPLAPPMFGPVPSAPPSFGDSATAPTFNLPSFGPDMNTNFLAQQNGEPPSYLSIFPPPATDKPN